MADPIKDAKRYRYLLKQLAGTIAGSFDCDIDKIDETIDALIADDEELFGEEIYG